MKLTAVLITIICLQVSATGYTQITISETNAPLKKIFEQIEKQSGYLFWCNTTILEHSPPVTMHVQNANLGETLAACFKGQSLTYNIVEKVIVVKELKTAVKAITLASPILTITGRITNEKEEPIAGATITVKGTKNATVSNEDGSFILTEVAESAVVTISSVGYEKIELPVKGRTSMDVQLKFDVNSLDEMVVIAYGSTTKRLNTGSVGKVTAEEISKLPVSNPLAALQGRVPGLVITESSGMPGAAIKIQIRGQNSIGTNPSILPPNNPLFIIDGIPFAPGNNNSNQLSSAANNPSELTQGGLSPFNSINISDIESIEVLKDADATAIYGSRGANGVILITTKKGIPGKIKVNAGVYSGWSKVTRVPTMLNTQQYIQMRREAFANDGVAPTTVNAPDLLVWDTTRYTDFKMLLLGGTAKVADAQVSLSGGNNTINFLIGSGYHHQTTLMPGDFADDRVSFHLKLNVKSDNEKFLATLSSDYSSDINKSNARDLTVYLNLPPNLPSLIDSSGKLKWNEKGVSYENPLAYLFRKYKFRADNLLSNLLVSYKVFTGLTIKTSLGYNVFLSDESSIVPNSSLDPLGTTLGSLSTANSSSKNWIIEPQIEYAANINKGKISVLVGGTLQRREYNINTITGQNYTDDALIMSLSGATTIKATNKYTDYRYNAGFGRISYNWKNKYLLNLTGRRDGSSRFGPGKQFTNFGAVGAAWGFSNENFVKNLIPFLSYGKIRGSYGTTGNDQIEDYGYLDSWSATVNPYQGTPGLQPTGIFNPDYAWEINKKLEIALEIGILQDHIQTTIAYYRNRTGNQLVQYPLPVQTGFSNIRAINLPALVENSGFEISLTSINIQKSNLKWWSSFNISIPKNKLISFPDLATSSYASRYVIGQSLSVIKGLEFLGIDEATGTYKYTDVDGSGTLTSADYRTLGNRDPQFYGGLNNTFAYNRFEISFFFNFSKQTGRNYLANLTTTTTPGLNLFNQPELVLDRWQKPGQSTNIQKFTSSTSSVAYKAATSLGISNGIYSDASFIRLKNVSLSYNLPQLELKKFKIENSKIYAAAQNLFTITHYKVADPETQNLYRLPPLRTITLGIEFTF